MRVLVISHLYPAFTGDHKGTFVQSQVRELVRAGVAAVVVAPRLLMPWPFHLLASRQRKLADVPVWVDDGEVPVIRPRVATWPRHLAYAGLADRILRAMRAGPLLPSGWTPDAVHAHLAFPDGVVGVATAREMGVPAVITVHGRDVNWGLQQPAIRSAMITALQQAATVVAVGSPLAKTLAYHGITARVVSNGVEAAFVARAPSVRPTPEPIVVTVANLVPGKGHDRVLRALAALRHRHRFRYWVVGGGPLAGRLKQQAAQLGLTDRVDWLGPLPHHQVAAVLAESHIFALPSNHEGFGVACLEAMAAGLPVVVSRSAGIADVLEHGRNAWLVDPSDVGELTDALSALLESSERRSELGEAAWLTAKDGYTWADNARQMLQIYQEVQRAWPAKLAGTKH